MLEIQAREKLLAEKRKVERAERERAERKKSRAACAIQRVIRGVLARTMLRVRRAAEVLSYAIASKDEERLKAAIAYTNMARVKSSQVKKLKAMAKDVLLLCRRVFQ